MAENAILNLRGDMPDRASDGKTGLRGSLALVSSDLRSGFRRRLGRKNIPWHKYRFELPEGIEAEEARSIAYSIRGRDYRPAICIHGVMPRSGTNYLADLFKHHEDVRAHPHRFWEFPLLSISDRMMALQEDFVRGYRKNAEVMKPFEVPAFLVSGLMRSLQESVGPDGVMLFKFPWVHYVNLFRTLFPRDYLVLLLRDGRDLVASSMKTFGGGAFGMRFTDYCREWDCAARTILQYEDGGPKEDSRTLVVRYEDVFSNSQEAMRTILERVELAPHRYRFAQIDAMAVRGSSELADRADGVHWQPWKPQGDFKPVGRWKTWSEGKKRKFKALAGETLIAAGYERSSDW